MKLLKYLAGIGFLLFCNAQISLAQDTLPRFTVEDKGGGRIVISWSNPYSNLIQLAVQRSTDSIKKFSTIYSSTSPELPVNGYSDKVAPGMKYFYRIFYVMAGGSYYFSKSQRPGVGLGSGPIVFDSRRDLIKEDLLTDIQSKDSAIANQLIDIQYKDSAFSMTIQEFKAFRDSILSRTNDTLLQVNDHTVLLQPYEPAFIQRTSQWVFTDRDGYVVVKFPNATSSYELVFLEEDDTPVLTLKNLKSAGFTLDKANFYHGGWYKFELRENGRILERNKIFLPSDF